MSALQSGRQMPLLVWTSEHSSSRKQFFGGANPIETGTSQPTHDWSDTTLSGRDLDLQLLNGLQQNSEPHAVHVTVTPQQGRYVAQETQGYIATGLRLLQALLQPASVLPLLGGNLRPLDDAIRNTAHGGAMHAETTVRNSV